MKKQLLALSIFTLLVISLHASTHYWVGGTGEWKNTAHWSLTSGGAGGAAIPTSNDDVIFDQNSFSSAKQTVLLTTDGVCHTIDWSKINTAAVFSAGTANKLTVTGSYFLSPLLLNGFKGQIIFASSLAGNTINTYDKTIIGNWVFDGSGSWILNDDVNTEMQVSISFLRGSLNTNGKRIMCGSFIGNASQTGNLNLSNSEIFIKDRWDFSLASKMNFNSGTSRIIFENKLDEDHFKSGGLAYNLVSPQTTFCNPSNSPCSANFVIKLSATNVTCNGSADGTATVVSVTGGTGPFTYSWNPGALVTQTITGLAPGTYTVKVTDNGTGLSCFCSIQITEPGVLFDYETSNIQPLCKGNCNGRASVDATGGTFPYTYSWSPVGGTNDTALNLCANTYVILVTDAKGCTANTSVILDEPNLLVAPGSSTNITCNGNCDGTATVTVNGGTLPYSYNWTPGNPTGDGTGAITNLCPATYTCTVTDANNCVATYSTIVTQPNILTLAASRTNTSCGGVCDGTATATVSGGTIPYTYTWSSGSTVTTALTTNVVNALCAGTYTITVRDANGCSKTASVTITQPSTLLASTTSTNVNCFNACDGTATATISGGTTPYTYVWSTGATTSASPLLTNTINSLCAGSYTVTITDKNNCTNNATVSLTQPALLIPNPTSTDVTCFGLCNGTATATPTGGTAPYTYLWNTIPVKTTSSITNLCPGTYSVTVTDTKGCDTIQSVIIIEPAQLSVNITKTNTTCNGACNGTANAVPTGGTSPYTFLWNTSSTTGGISGLCPSTYTVTVTDKNGCTATSSVIITEPNPLNVTINSTILACNGDCNATVSAVVTGGTPIYSYLWASGGQTSSSINNQCAGTYSVSITDSKGCTASNSITITQPTVLTIQTPPAQTNVSCFSLCDGAVAPSIGGGSPGYFYSWAPGGQTTLSISNQCAGTYTLTLRDANGCTLTNAVTITEPPKLSANPSVLTNLTCSGICNGSAISNPTGGTGPYVYDWTPGNPVGDGTPTVTNLCAGVYNVTVTDAHSCSSTLPVTIIQPAVLSAPITASSSSCNICNGTATVTPAGGTGPTYTFKWMPGGQVTQTATGLCPNISYTVTVTDMSGCTATGVVPILQTITINITTNNTVLSCTNACDGIVTANASGGTLPYSYVWSGPGGIVSLSQTATNLCIGTYTISVSDAVGCFNTDTVTFSNPPLLILSTTKTNVTCNGGCNGTATATPTGGTGNYTYSWLPGGQTTQTISGLCIGTYTATVADSSGCADTVLVNITQPTAVIDNIVTIDSANCTLSDGGITIAPSGGTSPYTYLWGPGTITGNGTPAVTNLSAGTYTLTITDATGCPFNFNYLVNNIAGPILTISHTNGSCNNSCNGTASVTASGGAGSYLYDWTPGSPAGDGTKNISALCGTTLYTVQVTDVAGCLTLDTATVNNPSLISPTPTIVNESCGGTCDGSISLAPTGGTAPYTYLWAPGGQTTSSITNLCASTYTVTVTDFNNCDSVLVISIVSPPTLTAALSSTNVLCKGACNGTATTTATGGTGVGTYTYSWSHGAGFVLANVTNLCPGSYTVTVTDGNLCTAKNSITINEPSTLLSVSSQVNISCNGACDGIAIVSASGGIAPYSYIWNPGAVANDSATGLCPGTYNATVTDFNGCISTPSAVTITQPTPIIPSATFTDPTCNGSCNGTATAVPTGGTAPYTYLWSLVNKTTQSVSNLCAGTYTVTVADAFGCTNNQNITLTDPSILNANASATPPSCANGCNGSATAMPGGGTAAYTYLWSPGGSTSQTLTNLCAGTYTVIVTDSKNCKDTKTAIVTNPLPIDAIIGSTPANCGICDGTITFTPTTGTAPYTYLWSPAPTLGQGTAKGDSVCAGIYNVTVTDNNGCDSTFTASMNNSGGPTGEVVSTVNLKCNNVCNGSGSVVPVGGTSPYSFLWNDPPVTANDTAKNLCAGNYLVQVTDANGCVHFSPVTITEPTPIIVAGTITDAPCSGVCTGAITITSSGGTGGFTYNWAPAPTAGQGTASVSGLCPGTYTLTTTDANSCTETTTFLVGQTTPLAATINFSPATCVTMCNGMAYVTITSGTAPYTIQWNDPLGQANDTATALCTGSYSVNVKDALGCSITLNIIVTSVSPPISVTPTITNSSCGVCDGQAVLVPSGGIAPYTYLWSNGQTKDTATVLCAGLYSVDITDNAGCVTIVSVPINNSGGPTSATITSTNASCFGTCDGTVTGITPVGGTSPYTFLWIQGGQTTATLNNLCAGIYYVQITDATGCSLTDSVIITEPTQIKANQNINATACNLCNGSITIAPSGGVAPYTVLWNTSSTALTISNLCAGVYSVQITDINGCVQNVVIPVNSQNGPTLLTSSTDIACNGSCNGTASVTATGGVLAYNYLWNDVSVQTTKTATSLCAGNYFVKVTDGNGCVTIASAIINTPAPIGFSVSGITDPLCNGSLNGSITTLPTGGTLPYTFAWSGGGTGSVKSGLSSGTYTVTVTDGNGCTAIQTATLTDPPAITITSIPTNASCNTLANGAIDITVAGGTPGYTYKWSGGSTATTQDISGLLVGASNSYTVTVTDAGGCTSAHSVTLISTTVVIANAGNDTAFCQSGAITLNASLSTNALNYQWFIIPANTSVGNTVSVSVNPPAGITNYYVVVDNGAGCSDNDTIQITSNPIPTADAGSDVTIVTATNTTIGGNPTGPAGSTYLWSPATSINNTTVSNPVVNPKTTTTYKVIVTSSQGCTSMDSIVITVIPTIVFPNGFSPNGDGPNDEWLIDNIDQFPNCMVEVYNRWGELLFQSAGYKEHWNGTYKGKPLPVGTYYYIINLNDPLFPDAYTGPITILR